MKDKIVVIGGGGHAKVIINVLKKLNTYDILGYTDLYDRGPVLGINYLGTDEILNKLIDENKGCNAAIGVGNITLSDIRLIIYKKLKKIGFEIPVIISPTAIINEDVIINEGTLILDGAIINSGSKIGKCTIINTKAIVEHDCTIGNFVHLTAGAITGGGVKVGDYTLIGVGAKIIQYKNVCANCVIGAGSIVLRNIQEPGTYFGVPARRINLNNKN